MSLSPSEAMVLGAVMRGAKKFEKIRSATKLDGAEVNTTLERLEQRGLISVREKSGWLGKKIEISATDAGKGALDEALEGMQGKWKQMVQMYESKDKKGMRGLLDDQRSFLPMMMFFGIMDMMMFSMMFSMIGQGMGDYVPADQMPDAADGGMDGDAGAGDFDFDIGF